MSQPTIYKALKHDDYFIAAFPDELIPDNSNIDKNKTGVGITTAELKAPRHSLLPLPSKQIIDDKYADAMKNGWNAFRIYEDIDVEKIASFLSDSSAYKKLLCTPESFWKVIEAAVNIDKLQWLYDNFFCYLDESHSYASEKFRDDEFLTPLDHFFKFKKKAMGTATYFEYSDPRFKALQKYEFIYDKQFGTINLIHHEDPKAVLNHFLTNPQLFKGKVFIFFNTVTQCGDAVINAGVIGQSNIYCSDVEKNHINLKEAEVCFKNTTQDQEFNIFNLFSCKYNQGWDLKDIENATIILVTDTRVPHSLVGIPFGGFQAIGRLRKTRPDKIYHITNSYDKTNHIPVSVDDLRKTRQYNAKRNIGYYTRCGRESRKDGIKPDVTVHALVKPYLKFEGGKACVHSTKLDQLVYEDWNKEFYANKDTVQYWWEQCNYAVELLDFDVPEIKRYRKSKAQINKEIIEQFELLTNHPERYALDQANIALRRLQTENTTLIQAYFAFGKQALDDLNYSNDKIMEQLSNKNNRNNEAKLHAMILEAFTLNGIYTNKEIKDKLQSFYDLLRYKDKHGKPKRAKASELDDFGLFKLGATKREGKQVFIVTEVYANVSRVA